MNLPGLKIGDLIAKFPIVQGGMAIRISTSPLAAAVADAGGVGTIAGTGMSVEELVREIREARKLTKGIIGVNVLFATTNFAKLVKAALQEKVDFIVSGAGFSRDMFSWGKEFNVPIIPIISSARLAKLAQKMGAAALVVEGKEAGGHLGTEEALKTILPEVNKVAKVPVIAAGGIATGSDALGIFKLGADAIQMGTRFLTSEECSVPDEYKNMHLQAGAEDIVLINSPVGLPGRAIRNSLSEKLARGEAEKEKCTGCLKQCTHEFCIFSALKRAQQGDVENGLVFSGESAARIDSIMSVKDIFDDVINSIKEKLYC